MLNITEQIKVEVVIHPGRLEQLLKIAKGVISLQINLL